jgi:hypothetical protein
MGKFTSWSLAGSKDDRCSQCGMKKTGKNCCNEKQKTIKLAGDQKAASLSYELTQFSAIISHSYPSAIAAPVSSVALQNPLTHSPPAAGNIPLYLRNCIFRI